MTAARRLRKFLSPLQLASILKCMNYVILTYNISIYASLQLHSTFVQLNRPKEPLGFERQHAWLVFNDNSTVSLTVLSVTFATIETIDEDESQVPSHAVRWEN